MTTGTANPGGSRQPSLTWPRIALAVAVVIWGWTFVATKVALTQLAPLELLALRFLLALPALGMLGVSRRALAGLASHRLSLGLASAIFALHFTIQTIGLVHTSATNTGWIIALSPLVIAFGAALWPGEKLGPSAVAGMAVATAGIFVLVSRGRLGDLGWLGSKGDWLVLGSTVTWALYTIVSRNLARRCDPRAVTFAVMLPATVIFAVVSLTQGTWQKLPGLSIESWVALAFLAFAGTALAQSLWQLGVGRLGAASAGLFLYLEPLATTALAVPYLGERLTLSTLVGGALVVGGVALAQRRPRA